MSLRGHRPASGFTLIEVMIVMAIMAMVLAMALPYLPRDEQTVINEEVERLRSRLEFAQARAILRSQDLGVKFEENAYQFLERVDANWQAIEDRALKSTELAGPWTQRLMIDDEELLFDINDESEEIEPDVLLYSSGEVTAFEYELMRSEQLRSGFKMTLLGEIESLESEN